MAQSEEYADYMSTRSSDFEQDRKFISFLFRDIVAPDEKLFDFYESINLGWVDDYPLVNTMIMKTFKQMKPHYSFDLKDLNVKEDDEEFLLELFRKTLLHQDEFTDEIDQKTPNWDTERIADIDMILIKMALTEFLYFPSIPTKVTINEYIEIAKDYSTTKSSYFINGVLDKLLKEYDKSGKLKKIGRGLL
jgi:N utilization substance protein B